MALDFDDGSGDFQPNAGVPMGVGADKANKTNPLGRYLDNLLRSGAGGAVVGGQPTEILGTLPQAGPLQQQIMGKTPQVTGIPPMVGLDEGGEDFAEDNPFRGIPNAPSLEAGDESDNFAADPITDAVNKAKVTGNPKATHADTYTADDAYSGYIGDDFEEGDPLSNTGALITSAGIAAPLMALLSSSGLGWLAARLGLGGQKAGGAIANASRGVADAARTGGGIIAKNPAISAGVGAAGVSPLVGAIQNQNSANPLNDL